MDSKPDVLICLIFSNQVTVLQYAGLPGEGGIYLGTRSVSATLLTCEKPPWLTAGGMGLPFLLEICHLSQFPLCLKSGTQKEDKWTIFMSVNSSISISGIQLPPEEEKFAVASVLKGGRPGNESWN